MHFRWVLVLATFVAGEFYVPKVRAADGAPAQEQGQGQNQGLATRLPAYELRLEVVRQLTEFACEHPEGTVSDGKAEFAMTARMEAEKLSQDLLKEFQAIRTVISDPTAYVEAQVTGELQKKNADASARLREERDAWDYLSLKYREGKVSEGKLKQQREKLVAVEKTTESVRGEKVSSLDVKKKAWALAAQGLTDVRTLNKLLYKSENLSGRAYGCYSLASGTADMVPVSIRKDPNGTDAASARSSGSNSASQSGGPGNGGGGGGGAP